MNNVRVTNKGGEEGAEILDATLNTSSTAGVIFECIVPETSVVFSAITSNWGGADIPGIAFTKPMFGIFSNIEVVTGTCVAYKKKPN